MKTEKFPANRVEMIIDDDEMLSDFHSFIAMDFFLFYDSQLCRLMELGKSN